MHPDWDLLDLFQAMMTFFFLESIRLSPKAMMRPPFPHMLILIYALPTALHNKNITQGEIKVKLKCDRGHSRNMISYILISPNPRVYPGIYYNK